MFGKNEKKIADLEEKVAVLSASVASFKEKMEEMERKLLETQATCFALEKVVNIRAKEDANALNPFAETHELHPNLDYEPQKNPKK